MWKAIRNCSLMLMAGIFLGTLLLCGVYLLPMEPMRMHVAETMEQFLEEGENPFLLDGCKGSSLDNYTDAIMLGNAVYDSDEPFYQKAMEVSRENNGLDQPMESLHAYVEKSGEQDVSSYARYWHGYLIVLKPLLLFFNYYQIRFLNIIIMSEIILGIIAGLARRKMWRSVVAYIIALLGLFPMTIPSSLQYTSVFYVGNMAVLFFLWRYEFLEKKGRVLYLFFLTGMFTSFVDFLTYPLYTVGMLCALWLVLSEETFGKKLWKMASNGIAWGIGYIGMWVGKWLVGSVLTGRNLFIDALGTVATRLSHGAASEVISSWMAAARNFYIYFNWYGIILFIILTVWVIAALFKIKGIGKGSTVWLLILLTFVPVVWYMVAANHSYIHYWYTFRNLSVSIFALGLIPECLYRERRCLERKHG